MIIIKEELIELIKGYWAVLLKRPLRINAAKKQKKNKPRKIE